MTLAILAQAAKTLAMIYARASTPMAVTLTCLELSSMAADIPGDVLISKKAK